MGLDFNAPAPFDKTLSLGKALLTPTRIYVRSLLHVLKSRRGIKALAHITGGGFPENIPRVLPKNLAVELDLSAIEVPPVFSWLAKQGNIAEHEMLRTYNCGIGMIVIVEAKDAADITSLLQQQGEKVIALGTVIPRQDKGVVYKGHLGL